jgi:uncharacterized coiled-coil DUF342 family protein
MAAPVKITCPEIDKYIKWIKLVMVNDRDLKRLNEQELFDTASAMNTELQECIGYLESLRSSNDELRKWGEGLTDELEEAANQINNLENELEETKQSIM